MCLPVRCYSCGSIIGTLKIYNAIIHAHKTNNFEQLYKKFYISRYCCRSIILTSVNMLEKLNK